MIRIWLPRATEIPIHEQLSAQLVLGIFSRRLAPGERLPSVRALARQLRLHPNTISTAYCALVNGGWLRRRRGSGVYVADLHWPIAGDTAEAFARESFEEGLKRGFSVGSLQQAFASSGAELRTLLQLSNTFFDPVHC